VAGWFTLKNLETEEEWAIVKPWLETPIDFTKVKQHCDNFIAIFLDNDEFVGMENKTMFEEKPGAKILVEHQKGHFRGEDGVMELPSVLKTVIEISESKR